MGRRGCVVLLIFALLSVGGTSTADTRRAGDPDDARGPLDIAAVAHSHRAIDGRWRLVHTVRLHHRWPVQRLRDRGFINLFFDTDEYNDQGPPERAVYVTYQRGRLRAEMMNFSAEPAESMGYVRLRRPNGRTIKVSFPRSKLRDEPSRFYQWQAASFVDERDRSCGIRGGCTDVAPNDRTLRHDLSG